MTSRTFRIIRSLIAAGVVLLGLAACDRSPTSDLVDSAAIRETVFDTTTYTNTTTANGGWGVGMTTIVEGDLVNAHLMYTVDRPDVAAVVPGNYDPTPGFSPTTGNPVWAYNETLDIVPTGKATGVVTVTVWPQSAPWMKKHLVLTVKQDGLCMDPSARFYLGPLPCSY